MCRLNFEDLKKLNIVLKRAAYFITCSGRYMPGIKFEQDFIYNNLTADARRSPGSGLPLLPQHEQLSLFRPEPLMLAM
jgi:predicted DNA-binding helix-hairpin-helix protein